MLLGLGWSNKTYEVPNDNRHEISTRDGKYLVHSFCMAVLNDGSFESQ